jgi:hypothetical protein
VSKEGRDRAFHTLFLPPPRRLPDKRGEAKSMQRTLRAAHGSTTPILASEIFPMPTRMMLRGVRNS